MKYKKNMVIGVFIAIGLFTGWTIWGNNALMVGNFTIENRKIPECFNGFRIAHISDFHNTEFGKNNEKLISMLKECKPDIIVITGDLIDSRRTNLEIAIDFSSQASQIAPTYYVSGNHESRIKQYEDLIEGLKNAGVRVLENGCARIEREGDSIFLLGIKDSAFMTDEVINEFLSDYVEEDIYTMLLSHRPELFETYVAGKVDLVFCGHAHGGQFRLPFVGGVIAPNQGWFPKYDGGLYTKENTSMVVSRGIGNSLFPLRINNRPEIVLVELRDMGKEEIYE